MLCIKVHKSYRNVIALCDLNLIGKRFEEGKCQLDLRENFYKEREITKEEVIKILRKQSDSDSTFNIVGEEAIQASIEAGIITEEAVHKIQNIPFTLILL